MDQLKTTKFLQRISKTLKGKSQLISMELISEMDLTLISKIWEGTIGLMEMVDEYFNFNLQIIYDKLLKN